MKRSDAVKFLLIPFLFSGMGCEDVVLSPAFTIGNPSEFRINHRYPSSDGIYTFKITNVNDSRCPEGGECVWAGEVYLKGEWTENNDTTKVEVHSVLNDLQKFPDGFTMQLTDVKPYPKIGVISNPDDLVITLLIKKK